MDLHVEQCGHGSRTAVLVHGLTDDHTTWLRVAPHLAAQGYRVLAPDLRGHGRSGRCDSYRLADFAADLLTSLPAGVDVLVGHSLGALAVGLVAEALAPRSLVYLDPPWRTSTHLPVGETAPRRWSAADEAVDRASLALMDPNVPTWVPGRVLEELATAIPTRLVAPTLVIEPVAAPLTGCDVRARLVREGYVFHQLAGVQHVMHRDDLDGFLAVLDSWLLLGGRTDSAPYVQDRAQEQEAQNSCAR